MKTEIVRREKQGPKLPEVGQMWTHKGGKLVWMRINDTAGRKYYGYSESKRDLFYSVCIEDGVIASCDNSCETIALLQPLGGVMKFEEVQ